jgi:tRNA pseudouridine38-40 synthase
LRYFLDISYVGTHYAGWQIQKNATGIQEILNNALTILLKHPTECFASGRTDAGVHALQQIVQFDTETELEPFRWLLQLNALLPNEIVANTIKKVKPETSARFDAQYRTYYYKLSPHRNPFLINRVLFLYKELDVDKMNLAAQLLLKHADFQCFSKVHTDVNHFNCQINKAKWKEHEDGLLVFTITANRFLRGMVRAIVGTLLEVGKGKMSIEEFEDVILSKDRKKAGSSVSANGLYLAKVEYRVDIFL